MATLTSTGVICSNGTLDGYYTGTTVNNNTFPLGSYIITNGYNFGDTTNRSVNTAYTVWSPNTSSGTVGPTSFSLVSSTGTGSTALAGTWRSRGTAPSPFACELYRNVLMQRTA